MKQDSCFFVGIGAGHIGAGHACLSGKDLNSSGDQYFCSQTVPPKPEREEPTNSLVSEKNISLTWQGCLRSLSLQAHRAHF